MTEPLLFIPEKRLLPFEGRGGNPCFAGAKGSSEATSGWLRRKRNLGCNLGTPQNNWASCVLGGTFPERRIVHQLAASKDAPRFDTVLPPTTPERAP